MINDIKKLLNVPYFGDKEALVTEVLQGGKVRILVSGVGSLIVSGSYPVGSKLIFNFGGDKLSLVGKSLGVFEG